MACLGEAPIDDGVKGVQAQGSAVGGQPSWRARARLAAAIGNSAMVCYVYAAHLLGVEWGRFGARALDEGAIRSVRDYLWHWDLDPVFEQLRLFTFSQAMLDNLSLYMIVGTPVSVVYFTLERDRIRWLQALLRQTLPDVQTRHANWWLDRYLVVFATLLVCILLLGPLHLELPCAHYCCAFCAIFLGFLSISIYLAAPIDLVALEQSGNAEAAAWASRARRVVRPALKFVLALHALALGAAVWKAESLGDDRSALLFGVLETALVLGYQLFAGVFVVDDAMVVEAGKQKLKQVDAIDTIANEAKPAKGSGDTDGNYHLMERLVGS
mmetsp:Transcript_87514/g.220193  ORF Transcript_87514/g.220193 Transcript_87514/m.220193 type:complete len:326 (+) Transcript_87514:89-1066(+)